jgi:ribose transport system permease protein
VEEKSINTEKSSGTLLRYWKRLKAYSVFWVLLAIIVITSIIEPDFLNPSNLINIVRQTSINGILAVGMTFVIITGGIDLSVGAIIGITAVVTAMCLQNGVPIPVAALLAVAIGAAVGAINGIGITKGQIAPFIMTLGIMTSLRGLTYYVSNGSPQDWRNSGVDFTFLGQGTLLDIPVPVYIFVLVLLVSFYILKYTVFGRNVYAIGDNREAARLSGIKITRVELLVYVLSGILSALSALVLISRLSTAEPTAGTGTELDAVAMTVIGGTSILGGAGGVGGTFVGAILLSVIANALNILNISPFIQQVVKGLIIIAAVLMELRNRKKN